MNSKRRSCSTGAVRRSSLWLASAVFACLTLSGSGVVLAWGEDAAAENQARLEGMTDAEKTALLQKKRRFDDLPAAEQERLREFHEKLQADSRQTELKHVLERYSSWLRTLTPLERAELTSLPPDKRLEKIGELLRAQDTQRFRMMARGLLLSPEDLLVIQEWCDKFIDEHAQEVLDQIPDDVFQNMTGRAKGPYVPERDRSFIAGLYMYRGPGGANVPRPSREDVDRLQALMSKKARDILARANDDKERGEIIQNWTGAAVLSRLRVNPSMDELDKFAQTLDEKERFRLENLPRDRMYRELRVIYGQKRFGSEPGRWGRRSDGKGRRWMDGSPDSPGPPGGFMPRPFGPGSPPNGSPPNGSPPNGSPPNGSPPNGSPPEGHGREHDPSDRDRDGKPPRPPDSY